MVLGTFHLDLNKQAKGSTEAQFVEPVSPLRLCSGVRAEEFFPKRELQGQRDGLTYEKACLQVCQLGFDPWDAHGRGEPPLAGCCDSTCKINKYYLEACLTEESTPAWVRTHGSCLPGVSTHTPFPSPMMCGQLDW